MLHPMTAVKSEVQDAIDNAIVAFSEDNAVVRKEMNDVLNPASEAERQQFRQEILAGLQDAKKQAAMESAGSKDFYVSHDPSVGLAQSAMNAAVEQNAVSAATTEVPFEQFGPLDPGWI